VCKALSIELKDFNRKNLLDPDGELFLAYGSPPGETDIASSSRVRVTGNTNDKELLWRFYIKDHISVSEFNWHLQDNKTTITAELRPEPKRTTDEEKSTQQQKKIKLAELTADTQQSELTLPIDQMLMDLTNEQWETLLNERPNAKTTLQRNEYMHQTDEMLASLTNEQWENLVDNVPRDNKTSNY